VASPSVEDLSHARIAILGGLGFIGSNLARSLVATGADVVLLDSLDPLQGGAFENVATVASQLSLEIGDVRDAVALARALRGADVVFNLVGQTSHLDSMVDPVTDLHANAGAQLAILEGVRGACPAAHVIFASTRQIYGRPEYLPVDEEHRIRPADVNGIHKFAAEEYHRLYAEVHGLRASILRLTNTYGPRMRVRDSRHTFLGPWIRSALGGAQLDVYGDGAQRRDLNFVDDVVDALILIAASGRAEPAPYNLGSNQVIALLELAELVTRLAGDGSVRCVPFPPDRKAIDIGDYFADFTRIRTELGWAPRVDLEEGLVRTIEFFRRRDAAWCAA
jgi:dTDP-glucose 4,6-dehydratase/UDP-glucose 4-epimerase